MKFKRFKKFVSFMLALTFCFSCLSFSALAADVKGKNNDLKFQTIEEAGITREEAAEVLGLTPEETKNVDFYAVTAANHLVLNSGDTHNFPKFTFTDYNVGNYFTVNANKLKYGVIWEIPSGEPPSMLEIRLYPYDEPCANVMRLDSLWDSSTGKKTITRQSEWINTIYGLDYQFTYSTHDTIWAGESITSSVTMVVGVV